VLKIDRSNVLPLLGYDANHTIIRTLEYHI